MLTNRILVDTKFYCNTSLLLLLFFKKHETIKMESTFRNQDRKFHKYYRSQ